MAIYVCDHPPPPGNYGILQVYIDRGRTIARVPNPLDGKRVKNAPEFASTRKYAELLAVASPLASAAHRTLPATRQRVHYQRLAGKAIQWLKEGKSAEEVQLLLIEAVEEIRKELKQQRIETLIELRKACRKSVFSIAAAVTAPTQEKRIPLMSRKTNRKFHLSVSYPPDVRYSTA